MSRSGRDAGQTDGHAGPGESESEGGRGGGGGGEGGGGGGSGSGGGGERGGGRGDEGRKGRVRDRGRQVLAAAVPDTLDLLALACAAVLTGSFLAVLYHVVDVVGGRNLFVAIVVGSLALAVVFRPLSRRQAVAVSAVVLTVGLAAYLTTIPPAYLEALSVDRAIDDTIALLTGFSVMRMAKAGNWALAVAPGPTFLTWYFALRRERVAAALVGGLTLGFFVLSGDSGTVGTLLGVLGAAGLVGFGTLADHGAGRRQVEVVAGLFALMIVASAAVTAVPGGTSPLVPPSATEVNADLTATSEQVTLGGAISLSPQVQFTVTADRPAYWRVSVYDRYTGDGWIRTGRATGGEPDPPPGESSTFEQRFTARRTLNVMPAAAAPVAVRGEDARFTRFGDLRQEEELRANDSYTVESERPVATPEQLREAGTDYPDDVAERYRQTPAGMPDRVEALAANVTADAETPYEEAVAIQRWLQANKNYSQSVRHPAGGVVDTFLFEADTGYCVYYASAMATMLRTQGVPARFAVGYSPGQRVAEDEWVVRGYDSHAWVEVYFPDVGWVRFDPTPGEPRRAAEQNLLSAARDRGVQDVDTAASQRGTWTPETTTSAPDDGGVDPAETQTPQPARTATTVADPADDRESPAPWSLPAPPRLPPPETLGLWGVLVVGLAAGARRTGASSLLYRELWLRWLPEGPPERAIEAAYERVEYVLARDHRPRRADETVREYLASVDAGERAHRVAALRERARYGGAASPADAEEAVDLARGLAAEQSAVSRIRRGDSV